MEKETIAWKLEKNDQIITTISQQLVGYDEQWSVLEIAAIIKDIKEYIFIIATVMKVETNIIASITASPKCNVIFCFRSHWNLTHLHLWG